MQRLTRERARDERGASAVIFAILSVVVMGFAALALDIGMMQVERQQLQTGADAAALAVAQDCAHDDCGSPAQTADEFVAVNATTARGEVDATLAATPTPETGKVSVTASGTSEHLFAPVLDIDETDIGASATAAWGSPTGGTSVLPLALNKCEFDFQTDGGVPSSTEPFTILMSKTSGADECKGPSGNLVPGGFGWVKTDPGTCNATTSLDAPIYSDTGNNVPSNCEVADFEDVHNQTVLLPLFNEHVGTGNGAWYQPYGYAAFHLTGYKFVGQYSWNAPCSGNERCISGYFVEFVDLDSAFDYGTSAPDLGAQIVTLLPDSEAVPPS